MIYPLFYIFLAYIGSIVTTNFVLKELSLKQLILILICSFILLISSLPAYFIKRQKSILFILSIGITFLLGIIHSSLYTSHQYGKHLCNLAKIKPNVEIKGKIEEFYLSGKRDRVGYLEIDIKEIKLSHKKGEIRWATKGKVGMPIPKFLLKNPNSLTKETYIRVEGKLLPREERNNPPLINWANYFKYKGIQAYLYPYKIRILANENIQKLNLPLFIANLQNYCIQELKDIFSALKIPGFFKKLWLKLNFSPFSEEEVGGVVASLILGKKEYLDKRAKTYFFETGTVHILAVSGLHVMFIGGFLILIFRLVNLQLRSAQLLSLPFIFIYALLCDLEESVTRATIMYSSLIIANNLGRKVHFLQSLSLAGIIILLFQPYSLFLAGFQLSFLATWAILALYYYHLKERLDFFPKLRIFPSKYEKWKQNLFTLSLVSFIAWVATAPLILYYFNRFQPIAIIANILLTIFSLWYTLGLSFVLLIFIILTKVASIFSLFLPLLAVALYFSINFLLFILHSLLYFKWSWYLPTPSPLLVFIPYIFLLYFLVKRAKLLLISGLLLINLILLDFMYKQHNILFCHFFSLVRNRESTFISLPRRREGTNFWENNINLLINCGDENTVKYLLLPYFEKRGIKELTALFLSNNRNDHAGGYKLLLENIKIKALFHNGGIKLDNINIPNFILKKGDVVKIGKHLRIAVYNPEFYPQHKREDVNSLVLKLNYCTQDKSRNIYLLFPGAIPPFLQRRIILENNDLFPVDISYLPHHGRHISQEWLKKSKREAKLVISKFPSFDNNIKCTQKDSLRIGIDVGTGELISNPPFSLYILGKIIKG